MARNSKLGLVLCLGRRQGRGDLQPMVGDTPLLWTSPGAASIWWAPGAGRPLCRKQLGVTVYSLRDD